MTACHGVRCASAAAQAMATAVVRLDSRFERESPDSRGTTPFEACGRGNCPCLEITVTLPWNPSRRAPSSTSTMVRPEPMIVMVFAPLIRSGGRASKGASAPVRVDA